MNDETPNVAAVRSTEVSAAEMSERQTLGTTPLVVGLESMSVIDVHGAEAEPFLQGQFCNDLKLVRSSTQDEPGVAILNGYCTPKGRLLALPVVLGTADGYRLIVPAALEESLLKRLRMFVMRADVTFTPRADLLLFGLQGEGEAWTDILPAGVSLSNNRMGVQGDADVQTLRWFDGVYGAERWMMLLPAETAATFRAAIAEAGDVVTAEPIDHWTLGNIHAGVPDIGITTSDTFIPQMLNLQQIGGLSFTKGCYPGQEIVARMQYLGKLKRHMVHLFLPAGAQAPSAGDAIATSETETAAEVVSAVTTPEGVHILAVVRIGIELTALTVDGHPCTPVELPYELAQHRSENA